MARIRSIKPEFWTSEQVLDCCPLSRLMFIGMWNFADDMGRMPCSPKSIKAQVFPGDDITLERVRGMLEELSRNGLISVYSVEEKDYLQITGWSHQRIDKPQAAKYPAPLSDGSGNAPRTLLPDRIGEDRNGKDSEANASGADAPPDPAIPEREYFLRGREVLGTKAGAMIANLLKAKGRNVALARAALEEASQKQNPLEYVAAICRGPPMSAKPLTEFQRKQQETNDVRAQLRNLANGGGSGGSADRFLPPDHGERPEGLRGGAGSTVLALPGASGRGGG